MTTNSTTQTFEIERDFLWRAPLLVIGATHSSSVATLDDDGIDLRFGIAHVKIPYSNVREIHQRDWAWYLGVGLRIAGDKTLGLIGSTQGVVQIALKEPSVRGLLFMRHPHNIAVSLSKPTEFIEAVERRVNGH